MILPRNNCRLKLQMLCSTRVERGYLSVSLLTCNPLVSSMLWLLYHAAGVVFDSFRLLCPFGVSKRNGLNMQTALLKYQLFAQVAGSEQETKNGAAQYGCSRSNFKSIKETADRKLKLQELNPQKNSDLVMFSNLLRLKKKCCSPTS